MEATLDPAGPNPKTQRITPLRVLIAGGGIAALEALLALRKLAGERVEVTLIAPDPMFRYRPLAVVESLGLGASRDLDLAGVAADANARYVQDALESVDPEARIARTRGGAELRYDALLVALGARGTDTIPGAVAFADASRREEFDALLRDLDSGAARSVAFAQPNEVAWPLGLYELALLVADRLRRNGRRERKVAVVTPDAAPMRLFGDAAAGAIERLLKSAGIELHVNSSPVRFGDGKLELLHGGALEFDRVVSLPIPRAPRIPGLPQDPDGFIPVDRFRGVLGVDHVFAAGDATTFPIKQGGLAAQAADCAAASIARLAGAPVEPRPFHPVLRGAILTGSGPRYLRAGNGELTEAAANGALWWPPAKVAGRHLAPYLASRAGYTHFEPELRDIDPPGRGDPGEIRADHDDLVRIALASADQAGRAGRYHQALRWLETAEDLQLYLPLEYDLKRAAWSAAAKPR